MNRTEAEELLAAGVDDALEVLRRWGALSADERRVCPLAERERFFDAQKRVEAWPSASARAREVLSMPAPPADTIEAAEVRRRMDPRRLIVREVENRAARRAMGPLDDDREPDVVDALAEAVLGPGWLRGECR
jgi:hypothetical protein